MYNMALNCEFIHCVPSYSCPWGLNAPWYMQIHLVLVKEAVAGKTCLCFEVIKMLLIHNLHLYESNNICTVHMRQNK